MGYDSGYYEAGFYNRDWYTGQNVDELAEQADEEASHHFNARRARAAARHAAGVAASAAMKPAAPPAPIPPDPVRVAEIALLLTSARQSTVASPGAWVGGFTLPPT